MRLRCRGLIFATSRTGQASTAAADYAGGFPGGASRHSDSVGLVYRGIARIAQLVSAETASISKGMPWRTFHRLCDRYDQHDAGLNAGLAQAVARQGRRYGAQ
jgi:hypothetical protein